MITSTPSKSLSTPSPQSPFRNLDDALSQAQTTALHLKSAGRSTEESYRTLDGFQASATDISRDTPWRDVSGSARELHQRSEVTALKGQKAVDSEFSAQGTLDGAISSLDRAIQQLPFQMREKAQEARYHLDQRGAIQQANLDLSYSLGAIYGGALPSIEAAELDTPGQDVSWAGGEIYGNLTQSLGSLGRAGYITNGSLTEVNDAISILRDLRERFPGEVNSSVKP